MATKQGTAKNDTLTGTSDKDQLAGLDGNDLLRGLGGADVLIGGNGMDRLEGGDGNDALDGGAGDDDLRGGKGDDRYGADHAKDITPTIADPGFDTVFALVTYTLGPQQEQLVLDGKARLNGTGNAFDNFLFGNANTNILSGMGGVDVLDGGKGRDVLRGGAGNDLYLIDSALEIELGRSDPGRDQVKSTVTYTLGAQQEELVLLGTRALSATGNAGDNFLVGNDAANVLRGKAGADLLSGGAGNDSLFGDEGDDELRGGAGIDKLHGGTGDDTYVIDDASEIAKNETDLGTDTVVVKFDYTLGAHQENLVIAQDRAASVFVRITGNSGANFLGGSPQSGDQLFGGDGDDTLNGGAGNDDLRGEGGNDKYFVDDDGDIDRAVLDPGTNDLVNSFINYTLGANQEELFLFGNAVNGTGNSGNNLLVGNAASNELRGGAGDDVLDGSAGDDNLIGEGGDDTYVVDHVGDIDGNLPDDGTDRVKSSISYILGAEQEVLELDGTTNLSGTGNTKANLIIGNSGQNLLKGGDGDDELDGLGGDDDLQGEGGNDTYFVDHAGDIGTAADPGRDRVNSIISYTLGAEQEELVLGGTSNLNGTGNDAGNLLVGNSGANELRGGTGNDELRGAGGADQLFGEGGSDLLLYQSAATLLDGGADVDGLFLKGSAASNLLDLTAAGGPQLTDLEEVVFDVLGGNEAAQRLQTYTLRVAVQDVLDLSSDSDRLGVFGELGDSLELSGASWVEDVALATQIESEMGPQAPALRAFTNGTAEVYVLDTLTVTFV